jgi:phospholipid/cholesterol/gamma-HCH transport system substrate-binding protein
VADRRTDLRSAVTNTARTMRAIAAERGSLAAVLRSTPGTLHQAGTTLGRVADTARVLRPALREVVPAAGPLRALLADSGRTLPATVPSVRRLRRQLPDLRRSIAGFVPLEKPLLESARTTGRVVAQADEMLSGFRAYGPDMILGVINGLAGISTGGYSQVGHYVKLEFVQTLQTLLGGAAANLLSGHDLIPGILGVKTRQLARCPGGNAPPAPDGSNPWVYDPTKCDPANDLQANVNTP